MSWSVIEQVLIFVLTFASVTLVNLPDWEHYAPFFGVLVQPLWIYKTWALKQWGMFALSIWFLFMWSYGIYNVIGVVV